MQSSENYEKAHMPCKIETGFLLTSLIFSLIITTSEDSLDFYQYFYFISHSFITLRVITQMNIICIKNRGEMVFC